MPDQRLPEPAELPLPPPTSQVDGQPGSETAGANTDTMQPALNSSVNDSSAEGSIDRPAAPAPLNSNPDPEQSHQRIPHWLQQTERFVRVIVRMYIGLGICCAPWYPALWDNNPLFASSPWLSAFATHGAVRGIVSGLGLLNLWIAVRDALHSPPDQG